MLDGSGGTMNTGVTVHPTQYSVIPSRAECCAERKWSVWFAVPISPRGLPCRCVDGASNITTQGRFGALFRFVIARQTVSISVYGEMMCRPWTPVHPSPQTSLDDEWVVCVLLIRTSTHSHARHDTSCKHWSRRTHGQPLTSPLTPAAIHQSPNSSQPSNFPAAHHTTSAHSTQHST